MEPRPPQPSESYTLPSEQLLLELAASAGIEPDVAAHVPGLVTKIAQNRRYGRL